MLEYRVNVWYSKEDECYISDTPELDSCRAYGDTPEEAISEMVVAQRLWLKSAREVGLNIPEPIAYVS